MLRGVHPSVLGGVNQPRVAQEIMVQNKPPIVGLTTFFMNFDK